MTVTPGTSGTNSGGIVICQTCETNFDSDITVGGQLEEGVTANEIVYEMVVWPEVERENWKREVIQMTPLY